MVLKYTLALLVPLLAFSTVYANWSQPQLSFEGATHPSVIQDRDGTFLMTLVRGADIFLTKSRDDGSWSSPIPVVTGPAFDSESRLFQDVNGTHWLVFSSSKNGNFDIFLARSNGPEWSEAWGVAGSSAFDSYPSIMQDSVGRYWIAFISNRDGNYSVHLTSSSDGVTWSEPRRVTEGAQESFPIMIQDKQGVYWLAFTRLVQQPNKFDIFLTNSSDGISWSEPKQITSDPSNNNYIDFIQDSKGTYWMAFTSERSGNEDIFIMGSRDGASLSEPVQLSFNMVRRRGDFKCDYKSLLEDSDGALRVYYHCVSPVEGIYMVRGVGVEPVARPPTSYTLDSPHGSINISQLTLSTYPQEKPSWSPDGRYIVYTDRSQDSKGDIWVFDTATGEGRPVSQEEAVEDFPAISPDGRTIVYSSDRGGTWDLWLMDADGTNKRQLTSNPAVEIFPEWSLDGRRIAYVSNEAGNNDIYVMDANGQNVKKLTSNPAHQNDPSWSPDGWRIAYESNEAGNWDIFVMDAAGGNVTQLTEEPENQGGPTWSPDGRWIAYESNLGGDFNVWVMASEGGNKARLTNHTADEYFPAWSPGGDNVAYQSLQGGNGDVWVLELPEPLRSAPLPPLKKGLLEGVRLPRPHISEMGWLLLAVLATLLAVAASRRYLKGPRRRR